jgi:hypothetical protein
MEDVLIPQCIAIWWRDVEMKLFVVVGPDSDEEGKLVIKDVFEVEAALGRNPGFGSLNVVKVLVVCTDEGFGHADAATHGGARGDREIGMIEE